MLRPRPIPEVFYLIVLSILLNISNSLSLCSYLIPIPESDTVTWSSLAKQSYFTLTSTYPQNVNLREFPIKFTRTCFSLCSSTFKTLGTDSSHSRRSLSPFSLDQIENILNKSLITYSRSASTQEDWNFPALILNKSVRSFTEKLRRVAEFITIYRYLSVTQGLGLGYQR